MSTNLSLLFGLVWLVLGAREISLWAGAELSNAPKGMTGRDKASCDRLLSSHTPPVRRPGLGEQQLVAHSEFLSLKEAKSSYSPLTGIHLLHNFVSLSLLDTFLHLCHKPQPQPEIQPAIFQFYRAR